MQEKTPRYRDEVISVIKQIERENDRDTTGGFGLSFLVAKWIRTLPPGDRDEVISVLLHQLTTGGEYGDLAPSVIWELADTKYVQQLFNLLPQLRKYSSTPRHGGRSLYDIALIYVAERLCNEDVRTTLRSRIEELLRLKDSTAFFLMGVLLCWGQTEDIVFLTNVLMREEVRHLISSDNAYIDEFLNACCLCRADERLNALLKEVAKVSEGTEAWLSSLITTRLAENPNLSQLRQ